MMNEKEIKQVEIEGDRQCAYCNDPINEYSRTDKRYCSANCRKSHWRELAVTVCPACGCKIDLSKVNFSIKIQ